LTPSQDHGRQASNFWDYKNRPAAAEETRAGLASDDKEDGEKEDGK
jgi:hypothetical protein